MVIQLPRSVFTGTIIQERYDFLEYSEGCKLAMRCPRLRLQWLKDAPFINDDRTAAIPTSLCCCDSFVGLHNTKCQTLSVSHQWPLPLILRGDRHRVSALFFYEPS